MFLSSWAGMAQFLLKQAIPTASPSTPSPPPTQAHSDTTSVGEDEDIELDSEDPIAIVPTDRTYEEGLTPSEGDVSWHTPDEPTEMPAQIVRIVDATAPSSSSDSSGEEPNQPDDEMEFGDSDSEDMDIVKAQITQMVDMGFSLSQVTNAVHAVGMDVDLLLEHLLANPGFGGDEPGNTLGQHTTNEGHVSAFTLGPAPMTEDAHMSRGMNPPETINHTNPDGNAESSSSVGAKSVTMADTNIVGDVCYEELQALAKRSMELVQMGYSFDQVQAAMTASNLRPDVALEYLKKASSLRRYIHLVNEWHFSKVAKNDMAPRDRLVLRLDALPTQRLAMSNSKKQ
ncbi:hypothetical protein FRB98_007294 [Tulasnella sp. 332]|nr:hypothetical protein FRB98_007294 [Tulasnella sp. 332]